MTAHNHSDQDDPTREFEDFQERPDEAVSSENRPVKMGWRVPYSKEPYKDSMSSWSRALVITAFPGAAAVRIIWQFRDRIQYWWGWSALSVMVIFLSLWSYFHRSMVKNFGRDVTEEIEHPTEHKHIG